MPPLRFAEETRESTAKSLSRESDLNRDGLRRSAHDGRSFGMAQSLLLRQNERHSAAWRQRRDRITDRNR
jgi:hypothetical protein